MVTVVPITFGALAAYVFPRARMAILIFPVVLLSLGSWIIIGWLEKGWDPELNRGGRILVLGLFLAFEVALWVVGLKLGRRLLPRT